MPIDHPSQPHQIPAYRKTIGPVPFVSWSEETFDRLVAAAPEPMVSRFAVTNSMLLNVIARPGNCRDHPPSPTRFLPIAERWAGADR